MKRLAMLLVSALALSGCGVLGPLLVGTPADPLAVQNEVDVNRLADKDTDATAAMLNAQAKLNAAALREKYGTDKPPIIPPLPIPPTPWGLIISSAIGVVGAAFTTAKTVRRVAKKKASTTA